MRQDSDFTLTQNGDMYERLWWPLVKPDFPEWEQFWIYHVVPLTNRIDDALPDDDPRKIFLREDDEIDRRLEAMVMANYSVFYFLGRASAIIIADPHLFLEDVFMLLNATTENVQFFLEKVHEIGKLLNIEEKRLPSWRKIQIKEPIPSIKSYRNTLLHAPRLGQNPNLDREMILKKKHLLRAQTSWAYVQKLRRQEFEEDGRDYLRRMRVDLMKVLNPVWAQIREVLDTYRTTGSYVQLYRLDSSGKPMPLA